MFLVLLKNKLKGQFRCRSRSSCIDPLVELPYSCTDGIDAAERKQEDLNIGGKDKKRAWM